MAGYWLISLFAFLLMGPDDVESPQKRKEKERGQYPAILTEQAWSIKDLLYGQKFVPKNFVFAGTRHAKREIPRWEKVRVSGRTILLATFRFSLTTVLTFAFFHRLSSFSDT